MKKQEKTDIDLSEDDHILAHYIQVAEMTAQALSPLAETVVNDLRPGHEKILAIFNGHITGRKVGDMVSDFGKKRVTGQIADILYNYENESPNGHPLKSSAISIRNAKGQLIGSYAINIELSALTGFQGFLTQFCKTENQTQRKERFLSLPPKEEIKVAIQDFATEQGWGTHALTKPQKIAIIKHLSREGHFYKQGAIPIVASQLHLTRPSVYKYLKIDA